MALVSQYEAFIFDYGGVLVSHQTDEDQAQMARTAGRSQEEFTERYWSERLDYDRGTITAIEYWQSVAGRPGDPLSQQTIDDLTELDSASWMRYDPAMWEWVDQLRGGGKKIAILSNMPLDLGEALKAQTRKLDTFDQVTLSYEVHSIKPEPAIYEHCLEGLGTTPEQTLFFDDRIANVQGAELLGIRSIQFTSRDEVFLRVRS